MKSNFKNKFKSWMQAISTVWFWVMTAILGFLCGISILSLGNNNGGGGLAGGLAFILFIGYLLFVGLPLLGISIALAFFAKSKKTTIIRLSTYSVFIAIIVSTLFFRPTLEYWLGYRGKNNTFVQAVQQRNLDKVKSYLASGYDPTECAWRKSKGSDMKYYEASPFRIAVRYGNIGIVQAMLDSGAKMDKFPLLLCEAAENPEMFQYLLNHGVNINKPHHGQTPLDSILNRTSSYCGSGGEERKKLLEENYIKCVVMLLKAGGRPDEEAGLKQPLAFRVLEKNNPLLLKAVLDTIPEIDVNEVSNNTTLLESAVRLNNPEIIKLLIERGAESK